MSSLPATRDIPSLNGLRAVAVGIVVIAHAHFPIPLNGSIGVSVFFFLSGYLITTLMRLEHDKTNRVSLGGFYWRRFLRIFPPLYVVLVASIALIAVGLLPTVMTWQGVVSAGTFLTNYEVIGAHPDPSGAPHLGVLWSLAVEEHFYLVFPLLFIAMQRWLPRHSHQVALLVTICLAIMVWRFVLRAQGVPEVRIYFATDTRADTLLWGAVLAIGLNPWLGEVKRRIAPLVGTALPIVCGILIWGLNRAGNDIERTWGYTAQAILMFGIFIPIILAPTALLGRFLNWRPVVYVGLISYSLYLTHVPAMRVFENNLSGAPHAVQMALGIAAAIAAAAAIKLLVEDPIRKRRAQRKQAVQPSM